MAVIWPDGTVQDSRCMAALDLEGYSTTWLNQSSLFGSAGNVASRIVPSLLNGQSANGPEASIVNSI